MKFYVNNKEIYTLTETQQKVICNDIPDDVFEADMARRVQYIINERYIASYKALKAEWEQKLKANNVTSIPLDEEEFARLVFSQPNYKSRTQRDQENKGE